MTDADRQQRAKQYWPIRRASNKMIKCACNNMKKLKTSQENKAVGSWAGWGPYATPMLYFFGITG